MPPSATTDNLRAKVNAVKELLGLFRWERLIYLVVTLISVCVLLTCAVLSIFREGSQPGIVVGLFGGSGGVLYTTGRLLKMWSDAIGMLRPLAQGEAE